MHNSLSDNVLTTIELPAQSASTVQTGAGVNMVGWDGVRFVINLGAFTGSAVADARVVGSANANFSGAVNISGAALTQVAAANNANVFVIDVFRPTNLYLRCLVTPAVNTILLAVTADRYKRGGVLPPTQGAIQTVRVVEN